MTGLAMFGTLVASLTVTGCVGEASWVRETPKGGTVSYLIRDEGDILSSPGRASAVRLMGGKCPKGFRIVHEGRIPRMSKAVDQAWRGQLQSGYKDLDQVEILWAVQFDCN